MIKSLIISIHVILVFILYPNIVYTESTTITSHVKSTISTSDVKSNHTTATTNTNENKGKKSKDELPLVIIPGVPRHNATMIFLHGLGDTGSGMDDTLKNVRKPYAYVRIICPTAKVIPVTWKGGKEMHAWYDIKDDQHLEEDTKGIEKATAFVHTLISREIKKGIPPNRIVLGGFTQGANLAIRAALTYPKKLAGVLSFSKMMTEDEIHYQAINDPPKYPIPIVEMDGAVDDVMTYAIPDDYKFQSSCGEKHGITVSEMIEIDRFFRLKVP